MSLWTAEAIAAEIERRKEYLRRGVCPDSGQALMLDNPYADVIPGRIACEMCDCFGYNPTIPLEEQAT